MEKINQIIEAIRTLSEKQKRVVDVVQSQVERMNVLEKNSRIVLSTIQNQEKIIRDQQNTIRKMNIDLNNIKSELENIKSTMRSINK